MPYMTRLLQSTFHRSCVLALVAVMACLPLAHAERGDRSKPLEIQADEGGGYDFLKQRGTFTRNVVATKGTMVLRSDSLEVWETPEGYQQGIAIGTPGKPATFKQKRDGVDESIEGQAQRIEYDGRNDTYRLINAAVVRRLRDGKVADEVSGNLITYDNTSEVFNVTNNTPATAAASSASEPRGRVRVTLTPPPEPAASGGAPAALPLRGSGALGESAAGASAPRAAPAAEAGASR